MVNPLTNLKDKRGMNCHTVVYLMLYFLCTLIRLFLMCFPVRIQFRGVLFHLILYSVESATPAAHQRNKGSEKNRGRWGMLCVVSRNIVVGLQCFLWSYSNPACVHKYVFLLSPLDAFGLTCPQGWIKPVKVSCVCIHVWVCVQVCERCCEMY